MIELDRTLSTPLAEQLVEQLRFQLATGRYQIGERLPSTRKFAEQLGVSFHTVRKAYQLLEAEGLLLSRRGGGFFVAEPPRISTSERMERGAGIVQDAIQKLRALGFTTEEIEYQFEELIHYSDEPGIRRKIVFAAAFRERSETIAELISDLIQERVEASTVLSLDRHPDADIVITTLPHLQIAMRSVPQSEVVGAMLHSPFDVLEKVAHLAATESIGLVTKHRDAIPILSDEIRVLTGFEGQVIAIPTEGETRRLEVLLRQVDLVIYTPQVRRRIRPLLGDLPNVELKMELTSEAAQQVRSAVGR